MGHRDVVRSSCREMERKLPDWLEKHIAKKKAKEELHALLDAFPEAVPSGIGGSSLSTPSSSQTSEGDKTITWDDVEKLEDRLFQHVDRMNSPQSSQEGLGSQDSMGSKTWSETSLPNDFGDYALTDFVIENLSKREIIKACEPYPVFSKESEENGADFHADLYNGLRDHLFVCYRLVLTLLDKRKALEEDEGTPCSQPFADVSNSPTKPLRSPSKADLKSNQKSKPKSNPKSNPKAGLKRPREVSPLLSCSVRPLAP